MVSWMPWRPPFLRTNIMSHTSRPLSEPTYCTLPTQYTPTLKAALLPNLLDMDTILDQRTSSRHPFY